MKHLIQILHNLQNLTAEQMSEAMRTMMSDQANDTDIQDFLTALSDKGETVTEIVSAARALRSQCTPINAPADAVDCCGTGGDGASTYNISTAVALVAAASGVPMAKHGNRASSSKSGTADVLEALGVNLDANSELLEHSLQTINYAFLMASKHHKAMRHVAAARKAMKRRSIFNLIGPLLNPASTKRQLIGVYDRNLLVPIAESLKALGSERAWVVHGSDGLDEITVTGQTHIASLENNTVTERVLTPNDFGVATHHIDDLRGDDAAHNAAALLRLLDGEHSAYRDIVIVNTAAVLSLHSDGGDLKTHTQTAINSIDQGFALALLKRYTAISHGDL